MSLPIASAARVGNVEFVSFWDDDLARPVIPTPPEPVEGEATEDFEVRAEAFKLACDAFEVAQQDFMRRLKIARETQDWSDVLKPGANPVIFTCRPIEWAEWQEFDAIRSALGGELKVADVLVRLALVAVRGPSFDDFKVGPRVPHTMPDATGREVRTGLGKVAPAATTKDIARRIASGELAAAVIRDLGTQILNHWMRAPVP